MNLSNYLMLSVLFLALAASGCGGNPALKTKNDTPPPADMSDTANEGIAQPGKK